MNDTERKQFSSAIIKTRRKFLKDKKSALQLLFEAGITDKSGKLRSKFKHLSVLLNSKIKYI